MPYRRRTAVKTAVPSTGGRKDGRMGRMIMIVFTGGSGTQMKSKEKVNEDDETEWEDFSDPKQSSEDDDADAELSNNEVAENLPARLNPTMGKNKITLEERSPTQTLKAERRGDPTYLFYESFTPPDTQKGYKYLRCVHGNNKTVVITLGANGNLKNLRSLLPTQEEQRLANGMKMGDELEKELTAMFTVIVFSRIANENGASLVIEK
ncbi:hypothetical protein B0H14DRAFT_2637681 [Mycena olivaceomarginata]|nr:hypothetical protein B0H14DRAFT_2637681 [Mycena olivaceomarginata]